MRHFLSLHWRGQRKASVVQTGLCWRQSLGFAWCEWTILPSVLIISCLGCCISHSNMQDLLSMFVQDNPTRLYQEMNGWLNDYWKMSLETVTKKMTLYCKYFDCTKYSFWQCYVSHCNLAVLVTAQNRNLSQTVLVNATECQSCSQWLW